MSMFNRSSQPRAMTARGSRSPASLTRNRLKPTPPAPPGPPALVPYQPGFAMPEPMEALQDLSMAVAGRRRRSRLSIAGIGGM